MSRKPELEFELDRLQQQLPGWAQWTVDVPRGTTRWVRVPAGVALTVGGCLSILPGLGLWMLPVGLATLAADAPAGDPDARLHQRETGTAAPQRQWYGRNSARHGCG